MPANARILITYAHQQAASRYPGIRSTGVTQQSNDSPRDRGAGLACHWSEPVRRTSVLKPF
jgi:hypothetical protein